MAVDLGMGVDTNISPAFHPQVIAALDEFDDDTRGELDQVIQVFTATYESIGNLHDAREAVRNDSSLNEAAQILRVADHAEKLTKTATERLTKTASNLRGGIALIEKALTSPVQAQAAHGISSEIRAYAREQKSPMDFVRNAIVIGDSATVGAVLGAPHFLSGLSTVMHAEFLKMYHVHSNPVAAKRQRAMSAALEIITDRLGLLHTQIEKAVGASPAKVRQLRDAKAKADQAFAR